MLSGLQLPKLIYTASSKFNDRIEVYQIGDHYRLSVGGIVQSISKDMKSVGNRVWGKMVQLVVREKPNAGKILLLGLGGGTMVHLFKEQMPLATVTAVEIDEEMVKVAQQFFGLNECSNLEIIISDAFRVVSEPEKYGIDLASYDVVIVDVYCGDKYPDLGTSGGFFANVRKLLMPGGLVVFNRIYIGDHQYEADDFVELVELQFMDVDTEIVAGRSNSDNMLVYGWVEGKPEHQTIDEFVPDKDKEEPVYNVSNGDEV